MVCFLYFCFNGFAQIERVEPPNWWTGMKNNRLQLMVYGENIGKLQPHIKYEGVKIEKIHQAESDNYLFIDLVINANTKAGNFDISFSEGDKEITTYTYSIKNRRSKAADIQGFDASDVIYLITPDRFANGDPANDNSDDLREKNIDRKNDYARHGGDIRGIINHLDYLHGMGFTAVWLNPLLENDMSRSSYHGYATTDYYKIDPRFGTLEDYKELVDKAKAKGIKVVMDIIVNHCGREHWWMNDFPFKDWLNYQDSNEAVITNHRRTTQQDIYASQADLELMTKGWFVSQMPDLNQKNPFMATYLIQNSIWWIETLGLGGIRQDTYPYAFKNFLKEWTCQIMDEYPNFSIVGEEWSHNPLRVAYWQQGNHNNDGYESCLKSTMDFPMQKNLVEALKEDEKWGQGLIKLYEGLANDFAYADPQNLLIFGDNHDMSRIFTQLDEDIELTKIALTYLLTIRGIPQIYYGTEILMDDSAKPGDHGLIRTDFPGGWTGDKVNGFTGEGLSKDQKEMQVFMQKLMKWRKKNPVIHHGKTLHFTPHDGTYVYFRYDDSKKVMIIINKNDYAAKLGLNRFDEILDRDNRLVNILSGAEHNIYDALSVHAKSASVFEVK